MTAPARSAPDWRPWRLLALAALLPVGGVVLAGTLGPPEVAAAATWALVRLAGRLPGVPQDYEGVQALANVVMFLPIGALTAMGTRPSRWPLAVLAGPLLSAGLEAAQRGIAGRVADQLDLVANSAGSLLGSLAGGAVVGVVALVAAAARLTPRPRLRASAGAAGR